MFATVASRLQNVFSFQNLIVEAQSARTIAQRDCENVEAEADTWDTYLSTLREAIVEAIAARRIAQRDYQKVQAEADTWERQLQLALKNSGEDLVRQALLGKNVCRDRASKLKALIDQYTVQVSTLKSQLAFWENQLAS